MAISFEIFPTIGVARVGTSVQFFIGPEPDEPLDLTRRDAQGRLLRQAARFRVFRCDREASGTLTNAQEVRPGDGIIQGISWKTHIVNRKAVAPRFLLAGRRNNATGNDATDSSLIIDPGQRTLTGPNQTQALDSGRFKSLTVPLGHVQTQTDGRLLVLGGFGRSESPSGQPVTSFADNDDWHDDVSDGLIEAQLTLADGSIVSAAPSWVVVAPPDFAPEIANLVTLYDVLFDLAIQRGLLSPPNPISFDHHVRPILERALGYQWVNRQAANGFDSTMSGAHGPGGALGNFAAAMDLLSDPAPAGNGVRQRIFRLLRKPGGSSAGAIPVRLRMPRLNDEIDSGDVLPLTGTQYQALESWSLGQFVRSAPQAPESIPDALTRVALEACAGGAFFPGIEIGRIIRESNRYMPNFAFRLSPNALEPGELTQRNAVPWQADFHLCRWEDGVKELGWWPAQRPDDVRQAKDQPMVSWARGLDPNDFASMIMNWHRLGFVKRDPADPSVFTEQDRDSSLAEDLA